MNNAVALHSKDDADDEDVRPRLQLGKGDDDGDDSDDGDEWWWR